VNKDMIEQFKDTLKIGETEFMADIWYTRANTYIIKERFPVSERIPDAKICYEIGTSVSKVFKYARENRCAVLNFADGLEKGGLVWYGATTQEESLCRASTLYYALDTLDCSINYYEYNNRFGYLCSDRVVYSEGIVFFKDDHFCRVTPVKCDVITAPAPVVSSCTASEYITHTVERMLRFMSFARKRGVEVIILGAWGCGAFGGDSIVMGRCFRTALDYVGGFKRIVFTALDNGTLIRLREGMSKEVFKVDG